MELRISPSVGVARLGNSPREICLSPDDIGGLPYDADHHGNSTGPISQFKDKAGRVKRQGQPFKILAMFFEYVGKHDVNLVFKQLKFNYLN